jgi:large subunit ribosomal protein L21
MEYAVFKTGGKQYKVKPGDTLDVEKLPVGVASVTEFDEVLAISDGGQVTFGSPYVPGAKVLAQVQSQYADKKIVVFKYKAKTRYRVKRGHRQDYTRLLIQDIKLEQTDVDTGGKPSGTPTRRRPAKKVEGNGS